MTDACLGATDDETFAQHVERIGRVGRNGAAVLVEHPAMDDDALADRLAAMGEIAQEVVVGLADQIVTRLYAVPGLGRATGV